MGDEKHYLIGGGIVNPGRKSVHLARLLLVIIPIVCFACSAIAEPNDCVGYWKFDETEGDIVRDFSGNGFDGEVIEAVWSNGIIKNARDFDGIDDHVEISDGDGYPDAIGELSVGSISVWFKFDTAPFDATIHPIFYLGDGIGGAGNSCMIIEVGHFTSGNNKIYFTVLTDNVQIPLCFDSGFNLEIDRWYHFVVIVGSDFNTGYLDGEELTDRHYNFGNASLSYFLDDIVDKRVCWVGKGFIGGIPATNYYDGKIDEIRIYDRPLTASEVVELYEISFECPAANLDGVNPVNFLDLSVLAGYWLQAVSPEVDIVVDGYMDELDLALMADYWLFSCE